MLKAQAGYRSARPIISRPSDYHGDGGIDERGDGIYRLRYRVNGRRFTKTFHDSLKEARKELGRLIQSGHSGEHLDPNRMTLETWIEKWIALNQRHEVEADGYRRRGLVNRRTLERYEELLRCHVTPTLGKRLLQKLNGTEIDDLYIALEKKLSARTVRHIHTVTWRLPQGRRQEGYDQHQPSCSGRGTLPW
jgi:integrase